MNSKPKSILSKLTFIFFFFLYFYIFSFNHITNFANFEKYCFTFKKDFLWILYFWLIYNLFLYFQVQNMFRSFNVLQHEMMWSFGFIDNFQQNFASFPDKIILKIKSTATSFNGASGQSLYDQLQTHFGLPQLNNDTVEKWDPVLWPQIPRHLRIWNPRTSWDIRTTGALGNPLYRSSFRN